MSRPVGEVRVVDDVTDAFAALVVDAWRERVDPGLSLALSGGSTARACYERLAADAGAIDWRAVSVYIGDERCVPPDDPDANQRLVREALLDRVGPVGAFHPMHCDGGDGDQGAVAYSALLAAALPIDLVHLGLGPDGHTASLFPGAASLDAPEDVLALETVDPSGRNPYPRMTITLGAIARCRLAVFTVSGAEKGAAWAAVRSGGDVPAGRVRAPSVLWLVDREAAVAADAEGVPASASP